MARALALALFTFCMCAQTILILNRLNHLSRAFQILVQPQIARALALVSFTFCM